MSVELSLFDFVDTADEAIFFKRPLPKKLIDALPLVLERQGKANSYFGMFAPTARDMTHDFPTFTGEIIRSRAGRLHIIGQETCRVLRLIASDNPEVMGVLDKALEGMKCRIREADLAWGCSTGMYCCGTCSCSYWRNLNTGSFDKQPRRILHGLSELKKCRLGNGRWRRFPFYYTLLALSELDYPESRDEINYALPAIEKSYRRIGSGTRFGKRRKTLCERLMDIKSL